jgi:hypothetical protein
MAAQSLQSLKDAILAHHAVTATHTLLHATAQHAYTTTNTLLHAIKERPGLSLALLTGSYASLKILQYTYASIFRAQSVNDSPRFF